MVLNCDQLKEVNYTTETEKFWIQDLFSLHLPAEHNAKW